MAADIGQMAGYTEHAIEKGLLYAMCTNIHQLRGCLRGTEELSIEEIIEEFRSVFEGTGVEGIAIGPQACEATKAIPS